MTRRKDYKTFRPPGRPPLLTLAMITQAIERAQAGKPLTEIAAEIGVHRNTLYKAVRDHRGANP